MNQVSQISQPEYLVVKKKRGRAAARKELKRAALRKARKRQGYATYRFKDVDPVINVITQAMKLSNQTHRQIASASGVSPTTLSNWKAHRTRRPQFCTIAAVAGALHREFVLMQRN